MWGDGRQEATIFVFRDQPGDGWVTAIVWRVEASRLLDSGS